VADTRHGLRSNFSKVQGTSGASKTGFPQPLSHPGARRCRIEARDRRARRILIRGKGRQQGRLPLWKEATRALRAGLAVRSDAPVPEVFLNVGGDAMTCSGFTYFLRKYEDAATPQSPGLANKFALRSIPGGRQTHRLAQQRETIGSECERRAVESRSRRPKLRIVFSSR
jgi:hypothetical protein